MSSILKKFSNWLKQKSGASYFNRFNDTSSTSGNQLSRAYANSVWVMRAIKHVAGPISSVPLNLEVLGDDGNVAISDKRIQRFWQNPFLGLSYFDGIEATVCWLKLEGDCFWFADDSLLIPFPDVAAPSKLLIAGPDNVRIVKDGDEVIGYEYTSKKGKRTYFTPEQSWHHKFFNPYDTARGLGELSAVKIAAESDYLAGNFQRNLNRSNGDQGVYVISKSGITDDKQREQITAQLRAKQRANQRGEAKVAFLNGGDMTIEDPKVRTPDAAFLAGRFADREEIYIGLGVPASMSSKQASYSIGSASDRYALIEETCKPTGRKICEGVDFFTQKLVDGTATVQTSLEWDEHSTMQEVRAERLKSADTLWSKGVPMSVIDEHLRLGMPDYAGKDIGYLPFSVAPVGTVEDPKTDTKLAEKQAPAAPRLKAFDEMVAALTSPITKADEATDEPDEGEQFQADRNSKEVKLWEMHMRSRAASIKRYRQSFKRVLMAARAETLANLDRLTAEGKSLQTKAAASDFVFDLEVFRSAFFGAMRKSAQTALNDGGMQVFKELGKDDVFTMPPEEVLMFIQERKNLLKGIPDQVHRTIMSSIEEGIQNGESMAKLAGRVKGSFNAIESSRALTIAQTETGAAYGTSRQASMKQAGIKRKKWLTSGNGNVRATHRAANGQKVPLDEDFDVGGSALSHPCDPAGDPSETINCHCVSIAVIED